MIPGIGRIVHYIVAEGGSAGQHRAAIIVNFPGGEPLEPGKVVSEEVQTEGTRKIRAGEIATVDLLVFGNGRHEQQFWNVMDVAQDPTASICGTFHEPERKELAEMPQEG